MNFETVANQYLHELEQGRVRSSSLTSYRSLVRTHLAPRYNHLEMSEITQTNNKLLKELVADLRGRYKPASILAVVNLFKMIVDSPCDSNGTRIYRCDWNHAFIGAPPVVASEQHAPMIPIEEVDAVVAGRPDSALYAFLAGSGCRIGEALALKGSDWDRDAGILYIRAAKTPAGVREIDIPWALNAWLLNRLDVKKLDSKLFPGALTTYRQRAAGITGFAHGFRRFRLTHLRRVGCNDDILRMWLGHSDRSISDRYSRLKLDRVYRRECCERAGIGFTLPEHLYYGPVPQTVENVNLEMP